MAQIASLKTRYYYKLLSNLVGLVINLGIQAIVPRGLGPEAYGNFHFLTNFFNQIVGFLELGTSSAFYIKLSQRQKDHGLITFYLLFMVMVLTILFFMVLVSTITPAHNSLWPGQNILYIYFAALYGGLLWVGRICTKMGDAFGLTVKTEIISILQKLMGLLIVVGLFFTDQLNIETYFYYHYIIISFMAIGQIWIIALAGRLLWPFVLPTSKKLVAYIKEFYSYSHPLFILALIALITGILDRWILQTFSGSVQQGFYSLAFQIGSVCFIFTHAMTSLIQREFSIAFANKDPQEMAKLFRNYIPTLYFIAAYLSCFVIIHAKQVIIFLGGDAYSGAILTTTIMAFYPLHMTYSHLSGSMFIATGQTRLYRNISGFFFIAGLPITYFFIAPVEQYGLGLESVGLAIKMVLIQFLIVNVQLYYNTKMLKLSFANYVIHQIVSTGTLLVLAFLSQIVINKLIVDHDLQSEIINFFLSGLLYSAGVLLLLYHLPRIAGLNKENIRQGLKFLRLSKSNEKEKSLDQ
ncbi:MAG: lipopolysaccharide biosynthesis protein [Magnetococcales bacterium]|nr:lipopolysaccharide biosynthesis protein [Magnetococcales bacterium]